jgi:hypothetical protein
LPVPSSRLNSIRSALICPSAVVKDVPVGDQSFFVVDVELVGEDAKSRMAGNGKIDLSTTEDVLALLLDACRRHR